MQSMPWPKTAYGKVWWEPTEEYRDLQGRLPPSGFYTPNEMPEIAQHEFSIAPELATCVEEATLEARQFDNEYGDVVAPFASLILRSEAAASSEIENLSASARAIIQAELGDDSRENATKIAANVRAMRRAIHNTRGVSIPEILAIHETLMRDDRNLGDTAGKLREEPVWIGGGRGPVGAEMAGVIPEDLTRTLDDLVSFAGRGDVPPLMKAAITHAHFENIHPFEDGNGRAGRALVTSMLRSDGVMRNVTVPISAALLTDTPSYYAALTSYRNGDAEPIVRVFSHATTKSVANGRILGNELMDIRAQWRDMIAARSDSRIWRLVDFLLANPIVTAASISAGLGIPLKTAYAHGEKLTELGILSASKSHGAVQWRSSEILDALDRFAERSGRRKLGH